MEPAPEPSVTSSSASAAFEMLHEKVQRWIWQQGWDSLRDIQERSIPVLLEGKRDLIVTAGTASGKTEAAFLPIVSRLASEGAVPGSGFAAIYVSPMRALINDQFGRMEGLCEELDIEVTKWHGDVSASIKAKARKKPGGILLITPESLEAIFITRGQETPRLFHALSYVVIDEMHAFMGSVRGKQLQSILHRIDVAAGRKPVRVGLSATLADEASSRAFLRPLDPESVEVLPRGPSGQELRLQVKGYISPPKGDRRAEAEENVKDQMQEPHVSADEAIIQNLFDTLRGGRNLIFAGSRKKVEMVTVGLSERTAALGVPEEFFAHHGSLSREHREEAERRMKDKSRPASIVCTTTLELGIDVGAIQSVAQLGPGHTVSGMRQRLGRSGRRPGEPAIMRVYVSEEDISEAAHPLSALRLGTVQTIAMLNLMLAGWNDPPAPGRLDLSTMVQQIMSLIAQKGGISPAEGWDYLVKSRVFEAIDLPLYQQLLRRLGEDDVRLLEQAPDGTLLPGAEGERLIDSRDIYAAFQTPEEYSVVQEGGRSIGQIPILNPVLAGQFMVLAGKRWRVTLVDTARKEILVTPASGGVPPEFEGGHSAPDDAVVAEMRRVYESIEIPRFLDPTAKTLLAEGRATFDHLGLRHRRVVRHEDNLLIFPWVGGRKMQALSLAFTKADLKPHYFGIAIAVPLERKEALGAELKRLTTSPAPEAYELAALVPDKQTEKFDRYLDERLLTCAYASAYLDAAPLPEIANNLMRDFD